MFACLIGVEDKKKSTPAGFEPALPKGNRFLIYRRNHLAMMSDNTKHKLRATIPAYSSIQASNPTSPPASTAHTGNYVPREQYRYALTNFVRTSIQSIIYILH